MHFHGHERVYTLAPDEEVCNCIQVLREEIQEVVDEGARTVAEVGDLCGAGGGCGECHPEIARLLKARLAPGLNLPPGADADAAVLALLAPLARSIGAEVTIAGSDADELVLHVAGDEAQKQTVALWAELYIDPLLGPRRFLEVE